MKSLWNAHDREEVLARFGTLTDDHTPRWGRMTAPQMIRHVAWALQMATGERPLPVRRTPLRYFPIKQLILYVFPFPKSAPTDPALVVKDSLSVAAERQALEGAIDTFCARDREREWPQHPAFGPLSGEGWGVFAYKHLDHHLRQFGA
ncbi:MAG: DUF1569 domain-containing protein [Gemmatimonadaceae bacterium]